MKTKTDEEKADSLVAYLDREAFECYFDNFKKDNAPNGEARSFKKVKVPLLGKFSTKNTDAEVMKEAVNIVYKRTNVQEFVVEASTLYKKAKLIDQAKLGLIRNAIESDRGITVCVLQCCWEAVSRSLGFYLVSSPGVVEIGESR